jgi:hypothetical protein
MSNKLVRKVILPLTVFSALAAAAVLAEASPSTLPILAKRTTEFRSAGKSRTFECLVYPDGITITRGFDGVTTTEEKNFSMQGSLSAKIDEVIATKPEEKKNSPLGLSYSFVAFRASASGIQNTVVLSSFDGKTGDDVYNPAPGAAMMRDLANTVCGN